MYYFAQWKRTARGYRALAVPSGTSYAVIAEGGRGARWALVTTDRRWRRLPGSMRPVDDELASLLTSAEAYAPALALARAFLITAGRPRWGPAKIATFLKAALSKFLRDQARSPYVLAQVRRAELGYRDAGEFVWILKLWTDERTGRALVAWVSGDYVVYVDDARNFRLTTAARTRLATSESPGFITVRGGKSPNVTAARRGRAKVVAPAQTAGLGQHAIPVRLQATRN